MTLQQTIAAVALSAVHIWKIGHRGLAAYFCSTSNTYLASSSIAYAALLSKEDLVFGHGGPIA
jgi:hypothetical protein